jgi:hypothetical protein
VCEDSAGLAHLATWRRDVLEPLKPRVVHLLAKVDCGCSQSLVEEKKAQDAPVSSCLPYMLIGMLGFGAFAVEVDKMR